MWPFKRNIKKDRRLTEFENKTLEKCREVKMWKFRVSDIESYQPVINYYSDELKFTISASCDYIYVSRDEAIIFLPKDTFGVKFLEIIGEWEKSQQAVQEAFILS